MMKALFITLLLATYSSLAEANNIENKTDTLDLLPITSEAIMDETQSIEFFQLANSHHKAFNHFGIGVRASTIGIGIEGATTLTQNLKLRAGINYATYSHHFNFGVNDARLSEVIEGNYEPELGMDAKLKFFSGHVLIDIHPMNYGIFHFTTGLFIGANKIDASGFLQNPETGERSVLKYNTDWPSLSLNGQEINVKDGNIDGTFRLGNTIKPYLGIGLGRSVPKNRLGFMFELGAIYQGDFIIEQGGHRVNVSQTPTDSFSSDIDDFTQFFKWWPMLNLQITYRIF